MTSPFIFKNQEIWGTVVSFQVPRELTEISNFELATESAITYFQEIDRLFSTYRTDSQVSKLREGTLTISQADSLVKIVWNKCLGLRELTMRAFDPWAVPGGFDPSGYVKGWAIQEALQYFDKAGIKHIQINAGGDIVVRGGIDENNPWAIGIQHPDLPGQIAKSYQIFDGAIASSGTYERGTHIVDPRVGVPAVGSRAATVLGPDAGTADALATALIVDGRDSVNWIGRDEFRNYSFWAVDKVDDKAWSYGHFN